MLQDSSQEIGRKRLRCYDVGSGRKRPLFDGDKGPAPTRTRKAAGRTENHIGNENTQQASRTTTLRSGDNLPAQIHQRCEGPDREGRLRAVSP